jgi:tetratricopeptide (TPR) repeat protein
MKKLSAIVVLLAAAASAAYADKRLDDAVAKADELIRKNRPEEAAKGLQKLVAQDPANIEAQVALGRILLRAGQTGQRDEAGAAFAKAAEVAGSKPGPVSALALVSLASYELLRGPADKAVAHAEAAVKAESTPETLAGLARAQVRAGKVAAGRETADRALQANASFAAAQAAKGEALLAQERFDEAVAAFRKSTELEAASVAAKIGLAAALVASGKAGEAVDVARAATQADQKSAEAFAILGAAIGKANPGAWSDAIAEAQNGAYIDPASPFVQYHVGQLFEQNNNYDQAVDAYKKALQTDPYYSPAGLAIVLAYWHKGDVESALKVGLETVKTMPENGRLQLTLGELLLRKDNFAAAVPHLEQAVKLVPSIADAHYFLALAYTRSNKPEGGKSQEEASKQYCKAVELAPKNLDYRINCGLALVRVEQYAQGVEHLQSVVSDPSYKGADAWINLGYALLTMKPPKPQEAVEAYKKGLSFIDPAKTDVKTQALVGLARAYDTAERIDEAIATYQEAAKLDPTYETLAAIRTAWLEFKKGLPKKDFVRTQEALRRAEGIAGADNASLARLKANIVNAQKGGEVVREEELCDINACVRTLQSNAATGAKLKAISDLKAQGREGAKFIASYGLYYQSDFAVRQASINALGGMKGAACAALTDVKNFAFMEPPTPGLDENRKAMEEHMRLLDLIRNAKQLYQKLQATCK